jgi:hypothetical protein
MRSLLASLALILSGTALAGTVPLAISQATARQLTDGYLCGNINIYEYAAGFDASINPTATVYATTRCSTGGRGNPGVVHDGWATVTWDLMGNFISLTPIDPPAQTPSTSTVYTNGPYSEHTQTATFQLVSGDPYVRDTAILTTP